MTENIRSSRDGDSVTITLCNPAKRNSLSLGVLRALTDAFATAGESDASRPRSKE